MNVLSCTLNSCANAFFSASNFESGLIPLLVVVVILIGGREDAAGKDAAAALAVAFPVDVVNEKGAVFVGTFKLIPPKTLFPEALDGL